MKKIYFIMSTILIIISFLFSFNVNESSAQATCGADGCEDSENMFNCPDDCLPAGVPDKLIPDVINAIVSELLKFAIALSVLALVYGGVCYVFSSGDTQKAENARKIIKYALLGIFIVGISFAIITIIDTVFH